MSPMRLLALLFPAACASTSRTTDHPVQKVINTLEKLQKQVVAEGQEEEHLYGVFSSWCANSEKTLKAAVKEEKEGIDRLTDTIAAKKEEKKALEQQIAELSAQEAELDKADGKAKGLRDKENEVFTAAEEDTAATIKAIETALTNLQEAAGNSAALVQARKQVKGLLGLIGLSATAEQSAKLAAFASLDQDPDSPDGPELKERPEFKANGSADAHVKHYRFKSGTVIELLKQLQMKFEADLTQSRKEETNAVNAYDLAKAAREDERGAVSKAKEAKSTELSDVKSKLETDSGERTNLQQDLQADSSLLSETTKNCDTKDTEWARRQKARALELEAMKKAVEILAEASGLRTEVPENPVPPPSPVEAEGDKLAPFFLQLSETPEAAKTKAAELLKKEATVLHSKALERLSEEIASRVSGPFDDVNNMIQKMIFHLQDEQMDEDKHKAWCDLELNKTEESIINKEEKLEELDAKIDTAETLIVELQNEIKEHTEMVAKITEHMSEAAEIRAASKKENELAIADAVKGQAAIADAISVLESHYKESGAIEKEPYELAQTGNREPVQLGDEPSTWSASYTGVMDEENQAAGTGVIAVLKKVSEDFSMMEADTKVQEESEQRNYEEEMKECEIEKARRLKDVEVKTEEKKRQAAKVSSLTETKKHVESEHEATEQYEKDLQKACVEGDSTYEDRKAARAQEIDALKSAMAILKEAFNKEAKKEDEPKSFLQIRRHVF